MEEDIKLIMLVNSDKCYWRKVIKRSIEEFSEDY